MKTNISKVLFTAIMLLGIASGCKKSDDQPKATEPNGIYLSAPKMESTTLVMYTSAGTTTDINKIKKYLDVQEFGSYFNVNLNPETADQVKLDFRNANKVIVSQSAGNASGTREYNISARDMNGFALTGLDSIRVLKPFNPSRSESFLYNIVADYYNNCSQEPVGSGFGEVCTFRDFMPFIKINDGFYLQIFDCSITTFINNGSAKSGSFGGAVRGIFNPNMLPNLQQGDTVIVQQKKLLFIKQ